MESGQGRREGTVLCPLFAYSLQLQWLPGTGTPCSGGWGVSCLHSFHNECRHCLWPYTLLAPPQATQPMFLMTRPSTLSAFTLIDGCFPAIWAQLCLCPPAHCLVPGGDSQSGHRGFKLSKQPQYCNPAWSTPAAHKDQERPGKLALTWPYLCQAKVQQLSSFST